MNGAGHFSFRGRIARRSFWLRYILAAVVAIVVLDTLIGLLLDPSTATADPDDPFEGLLPTLAACLLVGIVVYLLTLPGLVKRCHDRGRSGWFVLLGFVPFLNAGFVAEVLFRPGTVGPNRYGPDPLGGVVAAPGGTMPPGAPTVHPPPQ